MKTLKINKTTEKFLNYAYKGDGKYYTIEQGSQAYKNTIFENFRNNNQDTLKVISMGNDAPRGGKTGDLLIVEFTEDFKKIAKTFLDNKKEAQKVSKDAKNKEKAEILEVSSLITKVENEEFGDTCKRLGDALNGRFIEKNIFYSAVKLARK